jgi:hypothetical protein
MEKPRCYGRGIHTHLRKGETDGGDMHKVWRSRVAFLSMVGMFCKRVGARNQIIISLILATHCGYYFSQSRDVLHEKIFYIIFEILQESLQG